MPTRPSISFELYPPKGEAAQPQFWQAVHDLAPLHPQFMTVVYGAGGSTREWTMETSAKIQTDTGIPAAAHLSCVNTTKGGIAEIAHRLWASGVNHIVALRGDVPDIDAPLNYSDDNYYHYASELVAGLRELHDFEITVTAHPETHPEAATPESGIHYLKLKCDAGATRAITQFFFDNDIFYRFRDKAIAAGITTPIVPGLLPIHDFAVALRIAGMNRTSIPAWLHEKFEGLDEATVKANGRDVLRQQIEDLVKNGVDHLHFYTMNRADLMLDVLDNKNNDISGDFQ